ncbi:MAG: hypothetical protein GXP33_10875 [Spirochaetes bacterium]|nr:hypothetical protein [Spirochaetota bacterium]
MSRTVFFIDFDGVICDSLDECLVSSWIGYYRYYRKKEPKAVSSGLRRRFLSYRPFIRRGSDYLLIQELIDRNIKITSNEQFDEYRRKEGAELMDLFGDYFYRARDYLLKTDYLYWLNLNRIYPFILKPLTEASKKENIHILSTKKVKYIIETLKNNGITIPSERVHYSSDSDKLSFINKFLKNSPFETAVLIDDQIDNLKGNKNRSITPYLALWGFIDTSWLKIFPDIKTINKEETERLLTLA